MLLTDKNGLYHRFIQEMIQKTEGNFLIVLIRRKEDTDAHEKLKEDVLQSIYEQYLYDPSLIEQLSQKGQQPSVELLAKNFMVG